MMKSVGDALQVGEVDVGQVDGSIKATMSCCFSIAFVTFIRRIMDHAAAAGHPVFLHDFLDDPGLTAARERTRLRRYERDR